MKRRDTKIKNYRDYLEEAAQKGNKSAIEAIKELDSPLTIFSYYIKIPGLNIRRKQWKKKEENQTHTEQTQ